MRHFILFYFIFIFSFSTLASLGIHVDGYVKSITADEVIVVDVKTQKTLTFDRKSILDGDVKLLFKKMDRKKVYNFSLPAKAKIKESINK